MTWFIRIADAQTRLQGLLKEFPDNPELANQALAADPSPNKQYARPILMWARSGSVRLPEDGPRLNKALSFFSANLRKLQIKDIYQYRTFNDVEAAIDQLQGVDLRSKRQVTQDIKVQGSQEVFNANGWRVLKMTTPEAVCELGKGTKWCTAADDYIDDETGQTAGYSTAQEYLRSGPLFLFMTAQNGGWQKYAQATQNLEQIMDVMDRPIKKPAQGFAEVLRQLTKNGQISEDSFWENFASEADYPGVDQDLVNWFKQSGERKSVAKRIMENVEAWKRRLALVEDQIIFLPVGAEKEKLENNPQHVIDGDLIEDYVNIASPNKRMEEREPYIVKTTFAREYFLHHYQLKKARRTGDMVNLEPWPEYDQEMLKNPQRAEEMSAYLWNTQHDKVDDVHLKYMLKSAEITKDIDPCCDFCLKRGIRKWPELEKLILNNKGGSAGWDIIVYCETVLKDRWPEAEPILLQDTITASRYAATFVKGRWPELEERIMKRHDGWGAATYAMHVLRSRWPEMEKDILSYGIQNMGDQYRKMFGLMPHQQVEAANMSWYKRAQTLTPQQVNQYRMFRTPHGVTVKGTGLSANFTVPGTNQTISGQDIMNRVVAKLQKVLNDNGVHTIDTGGIAQQDALGVAISTQPGTVHVDIARVFNEAQQQAFPSTTEMDGVELDPDLSNDIVEKITKILEHEIGNTTAHESQHNRDYLDTFPTGKFESPESGAEAFGNQMANQYFKL